MSSNSVNDNKEDLSGAISSLNIVGNNESNNNEEKEEENTITMICAACGKEGEGDGMNNSCNKCDLVKYCNAACKKKHRHKHKKKCEKRVVELHDEKLFREPPPPEDCPICFLPLPIGVSESIFNPCCGKHICDGCVYAMSERGVAKLCAFCRAPGAKSEEEEVERLEKLMDKGSAYACYRLAGYYAQGELGIPQDWAKANELLLKAGELRCAPAYFNLGNAYDNGRGVEIDKQKARHYWELAAINGNVKARYNLGVREAQTGNIHRSVKHFILAARAGYKLSLDAVKAGFMIGIVTKDEYANTLRAYQKSVDEMKSEARDKAEDIMARYRAAP